MSLSKAVYASPIGKIQIEADEKFVYSISIVDNEQDFPEAKSTIPMRQCIDEMNHYFHGNLKKFKTPLAFSGSKFQISIWQLLLTIPFGTTISYSSLSEKYGNKKATRAVAAANGKNKHAIIVPCHRVIGNNGNLTGYAFGLERKSWLLQHEGVLLY
jgi:methylated-DNA-[protein]-cysteine S-methyltransferase